MLRTLHMIKLFMPEYAHIARIVIYQLLPTHPLLSQDGLSKRT